MGNVLADCQRCSVVNCDACTEVVLHRRSGPSTHARGEAGGAQAGQTGGTGNGGASSNAASRLRQASGDGVRHAGGLIDDDALLAAAIAATFDDGGTGGGGLTEDELLAQAIRREQVQEESRQRARLRQEQESEYEESLRIDQQKEIERAQKKQEEEEEARRLAEEEEAKRVEAEKEAAEAAEAEAARKERIRTVIEEARQKLAPEPAKDAEGRIQVMIRTPDGKRLKRAFSSSDLVAQLYHFANSEGGDVDDEQALAGLLYRLVSSMPRKVYEDRDATLEAEGFKGQCALLVEIVDDQ